MNPISHYKTYFQNISEKHTALVAFTEGGASFGIESIGDTIEGLFRTRTGNNLYAFVLFNPQLKAFASGDGLDGTIEGGFAVMKGGLGRDSVESDILLAYDSCFNIATDILLRMQHDSRNGHTFFDHGFDTVPQGGVIIEEVPLGQSVDGTFVAVRVVFSFIVPYIRCSGTLPSNWTDI